MPLDTLVVRFGLPAVAVGAGVEGEPFAIMGGLLAQHQSFPLWAAMAAAVAGAAGVDQFWFLIGRRLRAAGKNVFAQRHGYGRALRLLERHSNAFILLFRFAYGIRAIAPIAIGASQVPARTYVALEIAAAIVWGTGFTYLGFRYGHLIDASRHGAMIWAISFGALAAIATGTLLVRLIKRG